MKSHNKYRNKGYIIPLPFHYLSAFSILVYCDVVCVWEWWASSVLAPSSVPGNFTHWRLCLTDWGCYAEESSQYDAGRRCQVVTHKCTCMCVCLCVWASHLSHYVNPYIAILGALLFLDTDWRCVSSSGCGKWVKPQQKCVDVDELHTYQKGSLYLLTSWH